MPVTGPLFSLTARKTLGKTLTYSVWRGIQYVRTRVTPSNPQTAAQTANRNIFTTLNDLWLRMGPLARAPWVASATGQPYTDRNRFIQVNQSALNGDVLMTDFIGSPGVGGAVPPTSATPSSGGAGQLTLTLVQPTLPTGWTQVAARAIAFLQGNPTTPIIITPFEQSDAAAPFTSVAFTGLPTGTYVWAVWNELQAPDLSTRYSVSLEGTQAVA